MKICANVNYCSWIYGYSRLYFLYTMNINLKRKIPAKKPDRKKAKVGGFGQNSSDDESSESESEQSNFAKSIQIKSQKIAQQLASKNEEMSDIISTFDAEDKPEEVKAKPEGLKYMERLIDSKKRREKDRLVSRQEHTDKQVGENKGAIVFETDDYKQQKDEIAKLKKQEEEEERPNNALFYSNLLLSREKGEKEDIGVTMPNNESGSDTRKPLPWVQPTTRPNKTTKPANIGMHKLNYEAKDVNENKRLMDLIKSQLTEEDIKEYKNRYWKRHDKKSANH